MEMDVFDRLKDLQEILYKKFKVEKEIVDIPKALKTKEEMVIRLKKSYIEKNKLVEKKQNRLNSLNTQLSETEAKIFQDEEQMTQIVHQREYEVLDKQLKEEKENEQKIRKNIKKEKMELNELEETLKRQEELIQQNETEYQKENKRNQEQLSERENELNNLEEQIKKITPGLSEEILFKFDRIIRNKEGKGIVPISDRICSGCHMQLPAQFTNDVRDGKEIQFCPYCSRILYYEESDSVNEAFAYSEADAGGLVDLVDQEDFDID